VPVWEFRDSDMSDYSISVKVRNGRIKRKIAECGFSSVSELCDYSAQIIQRFQVMVDTAGKSAAIAAESSVVSTMS
jgi:hypothetical protein